MRSSRQRAGPGVGGCIILGNIVGPPGELGGPRTFVTALVRPPSSSYVAGDLRLTESSKSRVSQSGGQGGLGRGKPQVDTRLHPELRAGGGSGERRAAGATPHSRAWCLGGAHGTGHS